MFPNIKYPTMPTVTLPKVTLPSVTMPSVTLPTISTPSIPTISMPTMPTVKVPTISSPSIPMPRFHIRPSWNISFISVAKTLKYGAAMVPRDIRSIRMLTDHEIPAWVPTMPSGIKHLKTTEGLKGEWYYERRAHEINHMKLTHEEKIQDIQASLRFKNCILYIHGGAFCLCNTGTHRGLMYHLVKSTQQVIFSVDYRRPPEHIYPIPLEDCVEAYEILLRDFVAGDPTKIILAGDSAGGNLVVHLLLTLLERNIPLPSGGILISPWMDLTDSTYQLENKESSWVKNAPYDFITPSLATLFADCYVGQYQKTHPHNTTTGTSTASSSSRRISLPLPTTSWFRSFTTATSEVVTVSGPEESSTAKTETIVDIVPPSLTETAEVPEEIMPSEEDIVLRAEVEELLFDLVRQIEEQHTMESSSSSSAGINPSVISKEMVSPLYATDELLRQLPPLFITVGESEVLHDQIIAFVERLQCLEVQHVYTYLAKDMIHVYPLFDFTGMPQCAEFFDKTIGFLQTIKRGNHKQIPWLENIS